MKYDFFVLCPNHSGLSFYVSNGIYKFLMNTMWRIQELKLLSSIDTLSEVYWAALFSDYWNTAVLQKEKTGFIHENQMLYQQKKLW